MFHPPVDYTSPLPTRQSRLFRRESVNLPWFSKKKDKKQADEMASATEKQPQGQQTSADADDRAMGGKEQATEQARGDNDAGSAANAQSQPDLSPRLSISSSDSSEAEVATPRAEPPTGNQRLRIKYDRKQLELIASEIYNETIADVTLSLFTLWISQKSKHYEIAKRYIRELATDQVSFELTSLPSRTLAD